MADITVVETPLEVEPIESEVTWESMLSELRQALELGFGELRREMESRESKNQELISRLLSTNESLTSQITSANLSMMEKLSSLNSEPSIPEVVVVEAPVAESVVEENPEPVISEATPARPKRRNL